MVEFFYVILLQFNIHPNKVSPPKIEEAGSSEMTEYLTTSPYRNQKEN
jgi:hypothetical protein